MQTPTSVRCRRLHYFGAVALFRNSPLPLFFSDNQLAEH